MELASKVRKRVLIITYYWPPSAGSGVQRWLKFAKYLPEFGWEPVIFTPENPDFDLQDQSLEQEIGPEIEVLKFPIWEPYGIFRSLKRDKKSQPSKILEKENPTLTDKLGLWARANLLVPDPRVFWVKPAVNFLKDLIDKNQFHCIITTGPPHSMHLIGLKLKKLTGIPWFADFRDPWSKWEFLDTLPMTDFVRKKHEQLELNVLKEADEILTISPTFQNEFIQIHNRKIQLLTNGFDSSDFPVDFFKNQDLKSDALEILYTGVIDSIRNPSPFLQALKQCFETSTDQVKLRFVGKVSDEVVKYVESDSWLNKHIIFEGYVSHKEVFDFYKRSHLLLLILTDSKNAKGNIPGKLFEYMATGRPIIALGDPTGDSAEILQKAGSGRVFKHHDSKGIREFLEEFRSKSSFERSDKINSYSRKNLTAVLAKLLDNYEHPIS
ncbi:glycosyltransferase family 4 protein [Arthrospiribacter ruber]|uniref:Glycosyltransferase n=1 Tax=Arthrospiribacter ruber TaxID=2487934 RepID=A0A951J170_9BACT|nr:glycosyltransferase family 4 protein [Arthrospiribacter ruber]MBW3469397.1 glycosyltransferase [Arthrospiribacter ruber]